MTLLLEAPDTTTTNHSQREQHYFKKTDFDAVWLEGKDITALCGYTTKPTRDPAGLPLCQTCKAIYERLTND